MKHTEEARPFRNGWYTLFRQWPRRLTRLVLFVRHRRPAAPRPSEPEQLKESEHYYMMADGDDHLCYPLPNPVLVSLDRVLNYLWEEEFEGYMSDYHEERKRCVGKDIRIVRHWIWSYDEPVCSRCPLMVRACPNQGGLRFIKSKLRNVLEWLYAKMC